MIYNNRYNAGVTAGNSTGYNTGYNAGRAQGQNDVKGNPGAYGLSTSKVASGGVIISPGGTYSRDCGFQPDVIVIITAKVIAGNSNARYSIATYLREKGMQVNSRRSDNSTASSAMNTPNSADTGYTILRSITSSGFSFYVPTNSYIGSEAFWIAAKE